MENSKTNIIVLGLGILLTVTVAIFLLSAIWSGNTEEVTKKEKAEDVEEKVNTVTKIGTYISETNGQERMIKEYFSNLFMVLASKDKDAIYNITSKEYIEKYNLDKESLYKKLVKKNLIGKAFKCDKYAVADNERFGKIFSLEISSSDNSVIDKIIIIEERPREYKVSFDSYIGKRNQNIEVTKNGLKLRIVSVEEYKDVVYFKITLQNTLGETITINKNRVATEAIYLNLTGNVKVYNTKDYFNGKSIELKENETISFEQEFFISDLQSNRIKDLVIVDVYNDVSKVAENYEYNIYNK